MFFLRDSLGVVRVEGCYEFVVVGLVLGLGAKGLSI